MPFNYNEITIKNAWLLGFVFADGTIGKHQGIDVIKIYNKDENLLENIRYVYKIPYVVTPQTNYENLVYFIRISDPDFVTSVQQLGYRKDKEGLRIPLMDEECMKMFLRGFLRGKGSDFYEKTGLKGYNINFRSQTLINDVSRNLSIHSGVKEKEAIRQQGKNLITYSLKYRNGERQKIKEFLIQIPGAEFRDFSRFWK